MTLKIIIQIWITDVNFVIFFIKEVNTSQAHQYELGRQAAERLGRLCLLLSGERDGLPFDTWILPEQARTPLFLGILGKVYGTDQERERLYHPYQNRFQLYKKDYDAVMPKVRDSAQHWSKKTLDADEKKLDDLLSQLSNSKVTERLHTTAELIIESTIGKGWKQEIRPAYVNIHGVIAQAVHEAHDEILSTLFLHPKGLSIVDAYSESGDAGSELAKDLVKNAIEDVVSFRGELTKPDQGDHVWPYPLLVTGGVIALGLDKVPGFKEYAVSVGMVRGKDFKEDLIGALGWAVLCVGLVFTGPVGALVISLADLALAGTAAGLAYIREREQELGAGASAFRTEDQQLATSSGYADTFLAGAGALLAGIALFKAAKETRELLKVKARGIGEIPPLRA